MAANLSGKMAVGSIRWSLPHEFCGIRNLSGFALPVSAKQAPTRPVRIQWPRHSSLSEGGHVPKQMAGAIWGELERSPTFEPLGARGILLSLCILSESCKISRA
jgi:hypothetical protein